MIIRTVVMIVVRTMGRMMTMDMRKMPVIILRLRTMMTMMKKARAISVGMSVIMMTAVAMMTTNMIMLLMIVTAR